MAHLIDKDALVAEIERRMSLFKTEKSKEGASTNDKLSLGGRIAALEEFKVFINSLEVKEVDLEKYYNDYFKNWSDYQGIDSSVCNSFGECVTIDDIKEVAKHFFELGLKVNNEKEK